MWKGKKMRSEKGEREINEWNEFWWVRWKGEGTENRGSGSKFKVIKNFIFNLEMIAAKKKWSGKGINDAFVIKLDISIFDVGGWGENWNYHFILS